VKSIRGASITFADQNVQNGNFVNLSTGIDSLSPVENAIFKVVGGTDYNKSITLYPYYSSSGSYNAVIKGEEGTGLGWVTNDKYSGVDVNRYYLRDSSNNQTFGSNNRPIFLDSSSDGRFQVNVIGSFNTHKIQIPTSSDNVGMGAISRFIISNSYQQQAIDCSNYGFEMSFNDGSHNSGFVLNNVIDWALSDYGKIKIYPRYVSSLLAHNLWFTSEGQSESSRKASLTYLQKELYAPSGSTPGNDSNTWVSDAGDFQYTKFLLSRGTQRVCGVVSAAGFADFGFNQRRQVIQLDLCDEDGSEGYIYKGNYFPVGLGVEYNITTSPGESKFYLTQYNNGSTRYIKAPTIRNTLDTKDYSTGAEFLVTKPSVPQTVDKDINFTYNMYVDGTMQIDSIGEKTGGNGVVFNNDIKTDNINVGNITERTSDNGVSVEDVEMKDGFVNGTRIKYKEVSVIFTAGGSVSVDYSDLGIANGNKARLLGLETYTNSSSPIRSAFGFGQSIRVNNYTTAGNFELISVASSGDTITKLYFTVLEIND
jgi:hypothetical protein